MSNGNINLYTISKGGVLKELPNHSCYQRECGGALYVDRFYMQLNIVLNENNYNMDQVGKRFRKIDFYLFNPF